MVNANHIMTIKQRQMIRNRKDSRNMSFAVLLIMTAPLVLAFFFAGI